MTKRQKITLIAIDHIRYSKWPGISCGECSKAYYELYPEEFKKSHRDESRMLMALVHAGHFVLVGTKPGLDKNGNAVEIKLYAPVVKNTKERLQYKVDRRKLSIAKSQAKLIKDEQKLALHPESSVVS